MQKGNNEFFNGINTAATISFYLASPAIVGIVLGRLADGYFNSQPWATIVGIVVGMIAGMWAIYKKLMEVK